MPLPLLPHSALGLFAQRTRIPTSARSTGFCVVCHLGLYFSEPLPEGGLDLVTNRQGAI